MKKYAPHKFLTITFNDGLCVPDEELEKYAEIYSSDDCKVVFKVSREEAKNVATKILSSDMPVDDILIDEMEADEVVRKIFAENKAR